MMIFPGTAFAHPGKTDSNGGHTCKTNCAKWGLELGEYHIHGEKAKTAPKAKTEAKKTAKRESRQVTVEIISTPLVCSSNVYNCDDFSTHNEAQSVFEYCKAEVGTDIHDLDRDGDGLACENL